MKRASITSIFLCLSIVFIFAQSLNKQYLDYIANYSEVAMSHQKKYKIPTSITLAQGLLESGAGNSQLTIESNNHFGIKCHNGWTGPYVLHDDDKKDDCFRKYNQAEDSYIDHSQFLSQNPRYAFLFELNITDYRGWAMGLQKAGYATDKSYANKLIKVIETYELFLLDTKSMSRKDKVLVEKATLGPPPEVYLSQGLLYVVAKRGDTFESLAKRLDFYPQALCKYNEVPKGFPLNDGDIVYLQKKNKQVKGDYAIHIIQPGESIHTISQTYGVRMKTLYKLNHLNEDYIPNDGDTLKLK